MKHEGPDSNQGLHGQCAGVLTCTLNTCLIHPYRSAQSACPDACVPQALCPMAKVDALVRVTAPAYTTAFSISQEKLPRLTAILGKRFNLLCKGKVMLKCTVVVVVE